MVVLCGCDKTIPAAAMALARLNIPGVALYGGTIAHGTHDQHPITIQHVFEAVGAHGAGTIDDAELTAVERDACPGAGACGGQFTANTMAMVLTTLGLSPMGLNDIPATHPAKGAAAYRCGELVMECLTAAARRRPAQPHLVPQRRAHGRRHRRLDQRGAASAGHRPRGRRRLDHRGLRARLGAHPGDRRPAAGGRYTAVDCSAPAAPRGWPRS